MPAIRKNGGLYMPGYLGRFIDSLASFCEQVICFLHSPRPDELSGMDYRIVSPNVVLVDIGAHARVMERALKARSYTYFLKKYTSKLDVLLVRGPSPLLPAMVFASHVPTAVMIVGDYVAGINDLPQPRWRKEAIRVWSYWNKWGQVRAARRSLTLVNSRVLFDELKTKVNNLFEIRTTTLTKDDFFLRFDTCQSNPCRLLYVGRMDRAKGLLEIVEAMTLLVGRGEDIVLNLVGPSVRGDPILEEIQTLAKEKNIADRVSYLGSRPLGPELFECYKTADIFVNASLASEGFPRTIWEAMAHSVPVVATRVGSIPAYIENAAALVPSRDAAALAESIFHLVHDASLRQQFILCGQKLARENTLEHRTCEMVTILQDYIKKNAH